MVTEILNIKTVKEKLGNFLILAQNFFGPVGILSILND